MIRTSFIAVTAASAVGFEPEVSPAAAAAGFPLMGTNPSTTPSAIWRKIEIRAQSQLPVFMITMELKEQT